MCSTYLDTGINKTKTMTHNTKLINLQVIKLILPSLMNNQCRGTKFNKYVHKHKIMMPREEIKNSND